MLCLQFDELKIVSGGADSHIVVTDILTGRKLQSLRGHSGPVVALQFDHIMLLSASLDGTLRTWNLKRRDGADAYSRSTDKFHIVGPGESIYDIARRYKCSIPQMMAWNALKDPKKELYSGRRVIVRRVGAKEHFVVDRVRAAAWARSGGERATRAFDRPTVIADCPACSDPRCSAR